MLPVVIYKFLNLALTASKTFFASGSFLTGLLDVVVCAPAKKPVEAKN